MELTRDNREHIMLNLAYSFYLKRPCNINTLLSSLAEGTQADK
jgi:hypothetical protein